MNFSFTKALLPQKRGEDVGKIKRGEGARWMVVADGTGIPLTCSTHSTEKAEVKLVSETVDQARFPEVPPPLIADKGYGSDELRDEFAEKSFCSFLCIDKSQTPILLGWPKDAGLVRTLGNLG
jgi:hypothetical protein